MEGTETNDLPLPLRTCCAELFFDAPLDLDVNGVLAAIRARIPNVQQLQEVGEAASSEETRSLVEQEPGAGSGATPDGEAESEDAALLFLLYPDYMVQYTDGEIPAQHVVALPKPVEESGRERLQNALNQSWQWAEAAQTLERCTHSMLVMDLMASGLERERRLELFQSVLSALVELLPCRAIYRLNSEQLISPQDFLHLQREYPQDFTLLGGAFNVRMFAIADGAQDETVMDTLGLSVFGLTDFQCHFVGLEPNDVAGVLWNLVAYAWEHGDVIEDGHTIQGIAPESKWQCREEDALVAPGRSVVDLDAGSPFNVGH